MNKKKEELLLKILLSMENIEPSADSKNFQFEGYTVDDIENILEIAYDEGLFKGIESHSKDGKNWLQMRLTMAGMNIVEDYRNNLKIDILKATLEDSIGIAPIEESGGIGHLVTISKQNKFAGKEYIEAFRDLKDMGYLIHESGKRYRISLEGKNFLKDPISIKDAKPNTDNSIKNQQGKIFIIHGHDNGTKETVARFITKLGLKPIILHELPNEGRTIIEKFENSADVSYAIALLTPDDVGNEKINPKNAKPRARQNVIFEFGYFIGKLGRKNVCAITKDEVEIPSDYTGVLYIPLDSLGAWKTKLIKEFKAVGIDIDANMPL